jgi:ABC-type Fe3+ transport system substrate-binding protein
VVFPAQFANAFRAKGAPVRWIAPKDGVFFVPIYTALIKNASHPRAAQAFMNFMLDRDAQTAMAAVGYIPATNLAPSPIDIGRLTFLGKGAISEDQVLHINDWLGIAQRLKGE